MDGPVFRNLTMDHPLKITCVFLVAIAALAGPAPGQVVEPPPPPVAPPHDDANSQPTSMPTVVLKPGERSDIVFDSLTYDWGREKGNSTVRHDYVFTNAGNGTLEILNVRPSCSCTVAGEFNRIVEPGQTGHIPVEVATGKHNGRMTKTINVETNCEGDKKTVTLTIEGDVWQVIQIEPPSAAFAQLEQQAEAEKVIKIQSNIDAPLELIDLASSNKTFGVSLREKVPGKLYELVVKAIPPFSPGSNSGRITLKTNYPEFPTIEIHAYAYSPELVEVTPPTINVPLGSRTPVKRQVQITNHHTKPFKISNPQATPPGVKCTLTEMQPGKKYQLVVDFPAGFKAALTGDKVSVKTDIETMPVVNIPITMQGGSASSPLPGMVAPRPANPSASPPAGGDANSPASVQP